MPIILMSSNRFILYWARARAWGPLITGYYRLIQELHDVRRLKSVSLVVVVVVVSVRVRATVRVSARVMVMVRRLKV